MDYFERQEAKAMREERHRLERLLRLVSLGDFMKSTVLKDTIILQSGKETEIITISDPRTKEFYEKACELNKFFHELIVEAYKEMMTPVDKEDLNVSAS